MNLVVGNGKGIDKSNMWKTFMDPIPTDLSSSSVPKCL
uniref:Uncharacterized protein n=1 Tax=Lepeophtheirus salmonis TaxID=72036 RepID=A0A0K2TCW0_LEPSM